MDSHIGILSEVWRPNLIGYLYKNYKKIPMTVPLNSEPTNMSSITRRSHFIAKGCLVQWQARRLRCCYNICLEPKSNWISSLKLKKYRCYRSWNGKLNSKICNFFLDVMRADRDGVQTGWTYMSVIIVPWFARFSIFGAMTFECFFTGKSKELFWSVEVE